MQLSPHGKLWLLFQLQRKQANKAAAKTTPAADQVPQDTSTMVAAAGSAADNVVSTSTQRTTPSRAAAESSANEKDADHETPAAKYSSSSRMKGYVYVEVDPYDNCTLDMTPLAKQKKKEEEAKKLFYI